MSVDELKITINVVRQIRKIQPDVGLDPEPVRLVKVRRWTDLVRPLLVVRAGVLEQQPDRLTELKCESSDHHPCI